jgi:hypothetical protein
MKKIISTTNKIIRTASFALVIGLVAVSYTSCKKEGCTDSLANNFDDKADTDDGTCTYDREQFIGTYGSTSPCVAGATWNTTISNSSAAKTKVVVSNLGNLGTSAAAVADITGSTIKISTQNITDSDGDTWSVSSSSGTLTGNTISITITYTFGTNTLTCAETWNKQ